MSKQTAGAEPVKEKLVYTIILAGVARPFTFLADEDLCEAWRVAMRARVMLKPSDTEWSMPLEFKDEDGVTFFSVAWNAIVAIVQGGPPEEKK